MINSLLRRNKKWLQFLGLINPVLFVLISFSLLSLKSFSQKVITGERHVAILHDTINLKQLIEKERLRPTEEEKNKVPNRYGRDEKEEEGEEKENEGSIPRNLEIPPGAVIYQEAEQQKGIPQQPTEILSPAPDLNFNGLEDAGNSIPPDVHGAVGPNHLMVTLNTQYRIQTRAGATLSTVTIASFWSSLTGVSNPFDPKTLYDPYNNRWITVAVCNSRSATSSLLVAVSQTSDPTGTWYRYKIDATAVDTMWMDYPSVGFTKDWIVVTGNMFGNVAGNFQTGLVYVLNKANFYAGGAGLYTQLNSTNEGFTLCPATTYDNSISTMYLVKTWNGSSGYIRMYSITGAVGSEMLTAGSFANTANTWSFGSATDFAPQSTVANKIACNDDRILACVYRNGAIWCAHTVFLPATTPTRSALQWWKLSTAGAILGRDRVDDPTGVNFFAFPSISVNSSNDALMGFSKFSSTTFASAGYALKLATDANFQSDYVYKAGLAKYYKIFSGTKNRWGDYTMTQVDPLNDNDFWTLSEYASTPVSGTDRWGTWWAKLSVPNPPVANFNVSSTTACTNNNLSFSSTSSGSFTTYAWNFGAGAVPATSSSSGPVTVQYTTTGLKTISLTVSGPSGSDTETKTDFVSAVVPPDAATAISGSVSVCQGQNGVAYSVAAIANATGYNWTLPTGASIFSGANTNSITVNYNSTALSGTISVNGVNAGCSGASSSLPVTVGAVPSKPGSLSFTSGSPITINDAANATPYPSSINVTGFVGAVQDVNVVLSGFSHTWKGDVDVLLESPSGQRVVLSSDCGEIASSTSITLTFNDSAAGYLPSGSALTTGSFKPTNYGSPDDFPIPGPGLSFASNAGTGSSPLSSFNAFNPNGSWKLYLVDDGAADVGSIASWTLTIIGAVPNSAPVVTGTFSVCRNQNGVAYSIPAVNGATGYNWLLPPGASIASGANTNSITVNYSAGATSGTISVTPFNGCGNSTASSNYNVVVNAQVTAGVAISASPPGAVCAGTNVTFTATPANGGTTPVYQWKKNGSNAGTNSPTFSSSSLSNADSITCIMTSNATCVTANPATSNGIAMTVNPNVTASVSIAADAAGPICPGTEVTFTATPFNGGSTPVYQWKKNGGDVGSNSSTYSENLLNNGDSITCLMTSNENCVTVNPAASAAIVMSVTPCQITLNLNVFIEGYYQGNASMHPILFDSGLSPDSTACDSIVVELHDSTNPENVVASSTVILHSNGTAIASMPSSLLNQSFYIAIRTRNALETWSKNPVLFNSHSMNFDFTTP